MSKDELISRVKGFIKDKAYDRVEDIWMELAVTHPEDLPSFYEIAKELKRAGEQERVSLLLRILASHFETKCEYGKVLEILKRIAQYNPKDKEIRQELIACYRNLYKGSPNIEKYIELSGIDKDTPLREAIPILERWLNFDVGKYFYARQLGVGKVVETNIPLQKIVLDFEREKGHSVRLDIAQRFLTPLKEEHFLVIRYEEPVRIQNMAEESSIQLFEFILKSFQKPLTATEIREHLSGALDKEQWDKWWKGVKRLIQKHPNIKTSTGTPRTYEWCDSPEEVDQGILNKFEEADPYRKIEIARQFKSRNSKISTYFLCTFVQLGNHFIEKKPSLALELYFISQELGEKKGSLKFTYTPESLVQNFSKNAVQKNLKSLLVGMKSIEYKKELLRIIKGVHKESWPQVFSSSLFEVQDRRLWDFIASELLKSKKEDVLKTILDTIIFSYIQYPKHFFWLCKKVMSGGFWKRFLKFNLLCKLIEVLESDESKRLRTKMKEFLDETKFIKKTLENAEESNLRQFLDLLSRSKVLDDFRKDEIKLVIQELYPNFFKKEEDILYVTCESLRRKEEELQHILDVEIPKNSREIGRAASEGDLSENFAYKAAKEKQEMLFLRAKRLQEDLNKARIIDPEKINTSEVSIGTRVKLANVSDGSVQELTILGPWDSDSSKRFVSYQAPLAKSLLGKKIGNTVYIGKMEYRIIKIAKGL
ncbi:MAG TPA: hypothetical protein EYP60_09780 [bacterium (Candidatus Stahlbacteria)]|nr:hypothetical protein [Candidatus Stahlbacteria bacterium]